MRKTFTTLALTAAVMQAYCQSPLTLTQSNFPMATDSITSVDVSTQVTAAPAVGANQTWNYSNLNVATASQYTYAYPAVHNDPFYTGAQFSGVAYYKSLNSQYGYNYNSYFANTAQGNVDLGLEVPEMHIGLGTVTGNNNDSLIIEHTREYYPSAPRVLVAFPATAGSAWHSVVRHVVQMRLTVNAASVVNAPMEHVFYVDRRDTVVGWGSLTMPAGSGTNGTVDVIEERSTSLTTDSFYLNGNPAPVTLTGAFGLTQGGRTAASYRENFYTSGSWSAPLFVNFDSTYTTPTSAYISKNKSIANGIRDVAADMSGTVYPNPVSGLSFSIAAPQAMDATMIAIQDISGRNVVSQSINTTNGTIFVQLNQGLANGMYLYSLLDAKGKIVSNGKFVAAK